MPHPCLRPGCEGVYQPVLDGLTVEVGGYWHHMDLSEERCNVCGRTVEDAYEEEVGDA